MCKTYANLHIPQSIRAYKAIQHTVLGASKKIQNAWKHMPLHPMIICQQCEQWENIFKILRGHFRNICQNISFLTTVIQINLQHSNPQQSKLLNCDGVPRHFIIYLCTCRLCPKPKTKKTEICGNQKQQRGSRHRQISCNIEKQDWLGHSLEWMTSLCSRLEMGVPRNLRGWVGYAKGKELAGWGERGEGKRKGNWVTGDTGWLRCHHHQHQQAGRRREEQRRAEQSRQEEDQEGEEEVRA